ncbi:MAG: hypothetical protein EB124_00400 [Betaproteobacteria bacterium]|nr:hypothetical protein [Betaproteobacteria bacterium]NDG11600.1 hypothetical protein [Betaproteobacteria bacterium]
MTNPSSYQSKSLGVRVGRLPHILRKVEIKTCLIVDLFKAVARVDALQQEASLYRVEAKQAKSSKQRKGPARTVVSIALDAAC